MPLLIDGFNLIYKFPDLESLMYENRLNDARAGLIEKFISYTRGKKEKVIIIFDGKRNPGDNIEREEISGIDIFYSLNYSADHLIKEFIKQSLSPKSITLVTSDKAIIFFANPFKVKKMTSEEFSAQMLKRFKEEETKEPEKDTNPNLSEEEISFWEKIFKK